MKVSEIRKRKQKSIKGDPVLTLSYIADLWVKWNIKEITGDELAICIEHLLKSETEIAWKNYLQGG